MTSLHSSSTYQLSFPLYNKHLHLVLFSFPPQEFGIHYMLVSVNLTQFRLLDVI